MNDLIWVGNTLYPRWFIIAVFVLGFMAVSAVLAWIEYLLEK